MITAVRDSQDERRERETFGDLHELRDLIKALPASVTVQDAAGDFVLANEAACHQFGISAESLSAGQMSQWPDGVVQRRKVAADILRSGHPTVCEEVVGSGASRRIFLTTHRPVRLAGRQLLLSSAVDLTRQKATEDDLFRRAYFDELTGLPNRAVFEGRINSLLADEKVQPRFALAFIDIDNFKHINDYYGHAAGDALLAEIAKRLGRELRDTDVLARISGDEFLLLLSPIDNAEDVANFIAFLLERLKKPFFIAGSEIFASGSIGVSLHPEHGRSYKVLRQNADIALYRVKNDVKGTAAFFDAGMEREAMERMAVEQSLRLAILDKRFRCAFQPKIDIRNGKVKGIEALVRLVGDSGEIQAPGTFIDLAVELGLIDDLTHLVLAEIMKSIDLIDERFGSDTTISINVAAKQAADVKFMASFAQALKDTGCPSRFVIEVTEDAFISKAHFQREVLPKFRELGVGISIDDFGIGYSSLSALADITADEIKIDRSFIIDIHKRPRSQGILRAIESLSEALGMAVIAEGVETFEELAYLQAATRIRYAQGYYFSKPIFLDELTPATVLAGSEARAGSSSRMPAETRQAYSRASGFGR